MWRSNKIIISAHITFIIIFSNTLFSQTLIAHYPLDNNALDVSGYNNNGMILGGVSATRDRFGNPCGALLFNGKDGYIEVPTSNSLESILTTFSVSCWFAIESSSSAPDIKGLTLICKGDLKAESPTNPQYRVQILEMPEQRTVSINTDFTKDELTFRNHRFESNQWNHYCLTYDGHKVKEYINGVEIWSFAFEKAFNKNHLPLDIGRDVPGSEEFFYGALDDLRIYNSALSQQEINNLFQDNSVASSTDEFVMKCPHNIIAFTGKHSCSSSAFFRQPDIISNCDKPTVKQIEGLPSGSQFPLGTSIVAFSAVGRYHLKAACDFSITVKDTIPPLITCPSDTIINARANESLGINFNYSLPHATDNCSFTEVKIMAGLNTASLFPLGTTNLKFRATDKSGNASDCSYNVTIVKPISLPVVDTAIKPKVMEKQPEPSSVKILKGEKDTIYYEHELTFQDCTITLVMYDDGEEDNDTVSIFFNDKLIVDRQMIKLKKNGPIIRVCVLNPDQSNLLVSKAWNVGKIPPNTLRIDFYEGNITRIKNGINKKKPVANKVVHSRPGLAGAIKLQCKI